MNSGWILYFTIEAKPDYVRYGRCIVILSLQWWWLIDFKLRSMVMDNRMCIDGIFIVHVCGLSNQKLATTNTFEGVLFGIVMCPFLLSCFIVLYRLNLFHPLDEFYKCRYLTVFITRYFTMCNLWICRYYEIQVEFKMHTFVSI